MRIETATMRSPVGPLALAWTEAALVAIAMQVATDRSAERTAWAPATPAEALRESLRARFPHATIARGAPDAAAPAALSRYFEGDVAAIEELVVDPGGSDFQAAVWRALRRIPAGTLRTYGDLALELGRPGGARAVGGAVGANPIPIVVPCHRVVGSDGRLTGFGGGVARKRWLLEHEGALSLSAGREALPR